MTVLDEWARKWGVDTLALLDLKLRMGVAASDATPAVAVDGRMGSESRQQALVRLEAANLGVWLTRNNVGALLDARGIPVRYGLANESPAQNEQVKSADLIGMQPVLIEQHHVGTIIARFTSVEMKAQDWQFNPKDKHEAAQLNWANFVTSKGGVAMFCTGPDNFRQQMQR